MVSRSGTKTGKASSKALSSFQMLRKNPSHRVSTKRMYHYSTTRKESQARQVECTHQIRISSFLETSTTAHQRQDLHERTSSAFPSQQPILAIQSTFLTYCRRTNLLNNFGHIKRYMA